MKFLAMVYSHSWQGRNLAGKTGLFPVSYTAPAPPTVTPSRSEAAEDPGIPPVLALQPLDQEAETPAPNIQKIASTSESAHSTKSSTSTSKPQSDGEVMKATMTDVEKAIEQLGRGDGEGDDKDGGRSFSFASTRDGDLTDDTDREDGGEDWHKGARRKLADAVALRAADQEKSPEERSIEPPIEVELSDESDDEEEDHDRQHTLGQFSRDHPRISEEDEEEDSPKASGTLKPSAPEDNVQVPIETERITDHPSDEEHSHLFPLPVTTAKTNSSAPWSLPTPVSPGRLLDMIGPFDKLNSPNNSPNVQEEKPAARSPPTITTQMGYHNLNQIHSLPSPQTSRHSSVVDGATGDNVTGEANGKKPERSTQPSEWSVDEVVSWLKVKGFDDDVCGKFIGKYACLTAVNILISIYRARNNWRCSP
jgi:hypothetical protein